MLSTLTGYLISKFAGPAAVEAALKVTPIVILVVAAIVGYVHGDAVSRVALGLVALNEGAVGVAMFGLIPGASLKITKDA